MTEELNEYILLASEAQDMKALERAMLNFARIMCEKQKEICADNAEADYNFPDFDDLPMISPEVYVIKSTILNCKNATEI